MEYLCYRFESLQTKVTYVTRETDGRTVHACQGYVTFPYSENSCCYIYTYTTENFTILDLNYPQINIFKSIPETPIGDFWESKFVKN